MEVMCASQKDGSLLLSAQRRRGQAAGAGVNKTTGREVQTHARAGEDPSYILEALSGRRMQKQTG